MTAWDREDLSRIAWILPSKILLLTHDAAGKILDIFRPESIDYQDVIRHLKTAGTLAPFFDISELPGVKEYRTFEERGNSGLKLISSRFHTSLPRYSLSTRRIRDDLFLSRFSQIEFQPMLVSHSLHTYALFSMRKDLLVGFTPEFHTHFSGAFPDPEAMLQVPASKLFSPSPVEFQCSMIPDIDPAAGGGDEVLYDRDFKQQEPGPGVEALPVPLRRNSEGLVWENADCTQTFLTVLREIDVTRNDVTVSLTLRSVSGRFPYFVLGGRYINDDELPDTIGYMAGRLATPGQVAVKRNGLSAFYAEHGSLPAGETTLHFCKKGHSIQLFENDRRVAAFYDSDFLPLRSGLVSMGLRKGAGCVLRRLSVRTGKSADSRAPSRPVRQVIRLCGRRERYFTLDRFYNLALSQSGMVDIAGFFLSDITEMKAQIQELTGKYRDQVRREKRLRSLLGVFPGNRRPLIGKSPPMAVIRDTAAYASASDATVLIEGPTGAGKEVLARFIHDEGVRRERPFVKVDCATIPPTLIESRLFGHEKGAFTGAHARAIGLFETADTGTVFLDEAGNLTPEVQVKLLQFLNDFTITRVGGTVPLKLDVRVIAASNIGLQPLVLAGKFREDLYYRLHVVYIRMPFLRERREDIPELADHFLRAYAEEQAKKISGFTDRALEKLMSHDWPGNIRELSNAVQRAVIFCHEDRVDAPLISFLDRPAPAGERKKRRRAAFLLAHTPAEAAVAALRKHHGRVREAAQELGMAWSTLYKFLREKKIIARKFQKGFGSDFS